MRMLAVTCAVAALVGLSAAAAAQAAPYRADKLSVSEQKWVTPLIVVWNAVNLNIHLILDEERAPNALIPRSGKNNTLLTNTLGVFASCSALVKQAGPPPSTRLVAFRTAMKGMCGHIVGGANAVAKAIGAIYKQHDGKLAASLLARGTVEFKKGSTLLGAAQKQLLLIGGKNVFTA
jgi:hypothetical protein